jgi:hypothetical protein
MPDAGLQMRPQPVSGASARDVQLLRLLRLALLLAVLVALALTTSADPDLWGHVQFGRDIVTSRALHTIDPYSFTSDRPWINHEWLAEVIMYAAYAAAGGAGLVALKIGVLAGVLGCIIISLRHARLSPAGHDLLVGVAIVGISIRSFSVRPQLFSLLLFAALLLALESVDRRRSYSLVAIPLIFAAWANLHGGFLVGIGVLVTWLSVRVWQTPHRWLAFATLGISALAATLATPYGFEMWRFLWRTVGVERPYITDWRPAWDAGPLLLLPTIVVLVTAAVALRHIRGRADLTTVAIVVLLLFGTARVSRIDAFLALAVVMLLGPVFGRAATTSPRRQVPWQPWTIAAGVAMVTVALAVFGPRASCIHVLDFLRLDHGARPVLDAQRGRLLPFFDWGEYAIWHFAPNLKVSIDGRRETVYSDEMIDMHSEFYQGRSLALLDRIKPDVIWLPQSLQVVKELERQGWWSAFRGQHSVVLTRRAPSLNDASEDGRTVRQCFPGP